MKCPCCGGAELVHDTRDVPYSYKGKTIVVLALTADFCPACEEIILDQENGDRYVREISLLWRAVDAEG